MFLALLLAAEVAASQPSVKLNNGVVMPYLALGTNGNSGATAKAVAANVKQALDLGFKSIDTARDYPLKHPGESLKGVGAGIRNRSRESFFLISKVGGLDAISLPRHEYSGISKVLDMSMHALDVDFVDLMLLHFPPLEVVGDRCKAMQEQWRAMEDFYKAGRARAIGVSNYCQSEVECILQTAEVTPAVNQVLFHIGMGADPHSLKSYLDEKGIIMQAYSPLGGNAELITGDLVTSIGKTYNKTGAQVSLRWVAEHQMPFNTASQNPEHLQQDLDVFNFVLSAEHLKMLDAATSPAGEPNGGVPLLKQCVPLAVSV